MGAILQHQPARGTTNKTIAADLRASLQARAGVPAGATVGSFIAGLRRLGVTDDMPLAFIEFGVKASGNHHLVLDTEDDGLVILEGTVG